MSTELGNKYHDFDLEISELLKSIAHEHGLEDYTIKQNSGSSKGDGYTGVITAVELSGVGNSQKKTLDLIVKSASKGDNLRKEIPIAEAYQQESYIYGTVIPTFQQFIINKRLPTFPSFAKCYKTTVKCNSEALILENLKTQGFQLWERRIPMNEEHVAFVMKEYGRFHALSFAMKNQEPDQFTNLVLNLQNIFELFSTNSNILQIFSDQANKVAETIKLTESVETYKIFKNFAEQIPELFKNYSTKNANEYSVIAHGDCWTNNMMFKYEDSSNANSPVQVRFLDLQLSGFVSPIWDLAYFFYTCSSKNIVDNFKHYQDLYYNSLADYVTTLGSNPDVVYPRGVFIQQWRNFAKFGLVMSIWVTKIMLSEQDEVSDLAEIMESGKTVADAFSYDFSNSEEYYKRMRHLALHFVTNGFL